MAKTSATKDVYLICKVEPGMFRGEWLAFFEATNPESRSRIPVQLFVDDREVKNVVGTPKRNNPAQAWLRVSLVKSQAGLAEVVLPQPATPVGESAFVDEAIVKQESRS